MHTFSRGEKRRLSDLTPATRLEVGMGLHFGGSEISDVSVFGLDTRGQLSDDRYFVFFNQPQSPEGAIRMLGPRGGEAQTFALDLGTLPAHIDRLVFVVTVDPPATLAGLRGGHWRLSADGLEVGRYPLSGGDFSSERAIMVAELYRKDGWRVAANGQGFAGGLDAVLRHFGGEVAEEAAAPSPPPAAPPTPTPVPSGGSVNLRKVELQKRMEREAPELVSLAKTAQVSLEKKNLGNHSARVALCLDISGSMGGLYRSGKVQAMAERVLALATRFDDDGQLDIFLFGQNAHDVGAMDIGNFRGFIGQLVQRYPLEGGTYYGKAMKAIRDHYFGSSGPRRDPFPSQLPVYVLFLTDGQTFDTEVSADQVRWSSYEPIFWQFVGIGKSKKDKGKKRGGFLGNLLASDFSFLEELDDMGGRYLDNADFFSSEDPSSFPDSELYDLMMGEYPNWVQAARQRGLLR
ncbi:stress response protein SCP2 [Deinobacterium chartae]|uniref:Stress response protein SCP2 n=1 Tax=Deinobacterium chartae TaxID=521158 RepID=A0A841HYN0_9DEIO|nr:VWA domain-containing protein [Deinobacterium chartae]MBB6097329.1 stress response protein SCP2 [Deinobacterium chartae]